MSSSQGFAQCCRKMPRAGLRTILEVQLLLDLIQPAGQSGSDTLSNSSTGLPRYVVALNILKSRRAATLFEVSFHVSIMQTVRVEIFLEFEPDKYGLHRLGCYTPAVAGIFHPPHGLWKTIVGNAVTSMKVRQTHLADHNARYAVDNGKRAELKRRPVSDPT